jgi:HAD superfamily hydrolase (TIGR01484 family)
MVMMPKAVIFDLDGTLARSKSPVTKEVGDALSRLLKTRPVAVMSGGSWKQFETQLLPALPSDTPFKELYLFPVSAAECLQYTGSAWKTMYTHRFTKKERDEVLQALDEALEETGMKVPPPKVWGERIEDRGAQITFSGLGQEAPLEEKKRWDKDQKKRAPLVAALKHRLPHLSIRPNAMSSVDITRDGITKAYGLTQFSKMLSIPVTEMLYVGDALFPGGNDAVVYEACKEMCVITRPVEGPEETLKVIEELLQGVHGMAASLSKAGLEVAYDVETRKTFSRDTSIFERMPDVVVYPKNADEVSRVVKEVAAKKALGENVSVTARSAGTDMSGGPLSRSVVAVFTKYMNHIGAVEPLRQAEGVVAGTATTEPGVYYRDFEKATLAKGLLLPSYPASRSIAAMGGIFNNNSGGERTLEYGKTENYVVSVDAVLSDGTQATFSELGPEELMEKKKLPTLEGDIYRRMSDLVVRNREVIEAHRPRVSKNSAGYALWNVLDIENGTFNLAKLLCGAQGTLALTTSMTLRLVRPQPHRAMLVIFLSDLAVLPEIVRRVLKFNPESFESYDDHTFSLAVKYLPQMLSHMGLLRAVTLGISFLPELLMVAKGGVPKLVLMAEFSEDTAGAANTKAKAAQAALADMKLATSVKGNEAASEKYWIVRRESFSLLRKNLKGLYAAPFIDDFVVPPDSYPEFLPRLNALLAEYDLIYTIAGHVGNGNFHIIPLMDLSKEDAHKVILELSPKVYDLVMEYGGSTTGEHNDGIIRTPYLPHMFGPDMMRLFEETKRIFDPLNILNPGKKVGGTFADIERDMIRKA